MPYVDIWITGKATLLGNLNVPREYRYIVPAIIAAKPPAMKNACVIGNIIAKQFYNKNIAPS